MANKITKAELLEKLAKEPLALKDYPEFNNDKDVVLCAVGKESISFQYASENLKNDKSFIKLIIKEIPQSWNFIEYTSVTIRDDKEIMLEVVRQNGHNLSYLNKRLQNDYDIVLTAIKSNGYALEFASNRLKDNKEIVSIAINLNARNLEFASQRLQNDEEIVIQAVSHDGGALEFASNRLQENRRIGLIAISTNSNATGFVPFSLYQEVRSYPGNELSEGITIKQRAKNLLKEYEALEEHQKIKQETDSQENSFKRNKL